MPAMTITTDAAQATRMAAAVGKELGLSTAGVSRSATAAEVKQFWIDRMRLFVLRVESADIPGTPFDPT